jgi:hypothetical protein
MKRREVDARSVKHLSPSCQMMNLRRGMWTIAILQGRYEEFYAETAIGE